MRSTPRASGIIWRRSPGTARGFTRTVPALQAPQAASDSLSRLPSTPGPGLRHKVRSPLSPPTSPLSCHLVPLHPSAGTPGRRLLAASPGAHEGAGHIIRPTRNFPGTPVRFGSLGRSADRSPSLRALPCSLRGGKRFQGLPGPRAPVGPQGASLSRQPQPPSWRSLPAPGPLGTPAASHLAPPWAAASAVTQGPAPPLASEARVLPSEKRRLWEATFGPLWGASVRGSAWAAAASPSGGLRTCGDRRGPRASKMQGVLQPCLLRSQSVRVELSGPVPSPSNSAQINWRGYFSRKTVLPTQASWV